MPIAHSSLLDNEGTERTHIAHWNRLADSANADNAPDLFKYVFELERGWSFDGQDFPTRATINLSFLEEPFDYDQIRKIEIHGLDYNNTTLFAGFGTKYGEEMSYGHEPWVYLYPGWAQRRRNAEYRLHSVVQDGQLRYSWAAPVLQAEEQQHRHWWGVYFRH